MTPLERFEQYMREVERRLRWRALSRGSALTGALALAATALGAWLAVSFALSESSLLAGRALIFLAAGGGLALGLLLPLLRVNRKRAALLVEKAEPGFEQRVTTIESAPANPFTQLLAEEALERAAAAPPSRVVSTARLVAAGVAGVASVAVIGWLAGRAPGDLGYAAHLLWAGAPPQGAAPMFEIAVTPGDAKVRRGGDQAVEARLFGFEAAKVTLQVRPGGGQWESLPMESKRGEGAAWQFYLASVSQDLEYRIEAGRVKSRVFNIRVVDLPGVKQLVVRTKGPAWLGASLNAETKGGDIRAVEGSEAEVRIETDRPLKGGLLVMDDGRRVPLETEQGNWTRAKLAVDREGSYYIAAESEGQVVRISEDYFIEARQEKAPEIRIARPGRDAKVSPIEEVVVEVEAGDDFGLRSAELRYSVNGGAEKSVSVMSGAGKEARGTAMIALEDYKMSPGDIVSLYAVARDARRATQTDIYFLEAQPYEREYRQGQAPEGGGMGGGGQQQNDEEIAARQKEIIAATWNQLRANKPKAQSAENAAFLSDLEQKLAAQSRSLAQRMRSRELSATNEEFQKFAKEMEQAAQAMTEASATLRSQQWKESLPAEQRALQHLLSAQSLLRQIQVAFQRGGGGGGGGGRQGSMRDLESLFDLELDTEKNQYETAQTRGSASERAQQADEAMKKLEELAKRQQQLAREQQQQQKQMAEKRWAQENLRR